MLVEFLIVIANGTDELAGIVTMAVERLELYTIRFDELRNITSVTLGLNLYRPLQPYVFKLYDARIEKSWIIYIIHYGTVKNRKKIKINK